MKELLIKRKGKFIQYLAASFMFNIDRYVQMGIFALIMWAVEKGRDANYTVVVIITILASVYSAISFVVSRMLRIGYMRDTILDVRKRAFEKIMRMPFKQYSKKGKEIYLSNLINDINQFESDFFISFLNFLINIGMFVISFIILLFLDPILAAGMFGASVLIYLVSSIFSKKTVALKEEVSTSSEEFTQEISNTFHGLEILKLNRIEDKFLQKSLSSIRKVERKKCISSVFTEGQRNIIQILSFIVSSGVMVYLCINFKNGISLALATFIFQLASVMSFNLVEVFPLWNAMKASISIYHKITDDEVEDKEKKEEKVDERIHSFDFQNEIVVSDVTFAYDNKSILNHANFSIKKGKKYLIKGVSGAGKSTLMNLLSMTFDNYEGEIKVDGVEYKTMVEKTFHDKVAFIYQDVFLFEDTIRNNITLYKDLPKERVEFAAKACELDSVIADKKLGLDEPLSENGKNLSGGQRQRISIARAIAKQAEILFVDEGTSSLNEDLGKEIEKVFLSLSQTVIAISHRFYEGVTDQYDYVLEIKNGQILQYEAKEYFGEAVTC
ncbi:ATP-binding cassette domain-containing protein [Lachnoclostridium phytofermentans]|uniref:ABC transporter related n=1 Tax=Lachnoclostridium phytofermentans (strain ATCC 700394 / DSM 18823 / ISDg) TaxID=357809 RepID=A9KMJ0_LACP7|nr:ABC transporter ATP-binding protein [Lachnoclostridium phytofermentans]ABX41435.1 ABC transporter related [Lachnoclostridium phytofermentans ISDg]